VSGPRPEGGQAHTATRIQPRQNAGALKKLPTCLKKSGVLRIATPPTPALPVPRLRSHAPSNAGLSKTDVFGVCL